MPYQPLPNLSFRGLQLGTAPDEVGATAAMDGLNFELDRSGAVRARDGYAKLTSAAGASRYDALGPIASGVGINTVTNVPGTAANDSSNGATPTWAATSGTLIASVQVAGDVKFATITGVAGTNVPSQYLKLTNFGFAISGTATILGVSIDILRGNGSNQPNTVTDNTVKLVKGGTISGNNKAVAGAWPQAATATQSYGGAADLWGVALTPTDVNGSTFGMVISVNMSDFGSFTPNPDIDKVSVNIYYSAASSGYVLASATAGRIDAVNSDGSIATTVATGSDQQADYANVGTPASTATYIAVGTGSVLRKYAGGAFSTVANSPKGRYIAVQPNDNRLVVANVSTVPTGASSTASTSLVHFSNPSPSQETFSGDDFEYLTPGDGEDIQGLAAWRELLFAFKSTKYFVFYGNSTDETGGAVFNYRPVTTGIGLVAPQATATSPLGLFFLDRRGVYLTTGDSPTRVSKAIDPIFTGGTSAFFSAGQVNSSALSSASMCWSQDRLFVGLPLGSATANSHTFVYDPQTQDWMIWNVPMGAMTAIGSNPARLIFTYASGTNDLGQYAENAYTTDAGTAITGYYRPGFYTLGNAPDQEAEIRETIIDGIGSISFAVSRDFNINIPSVGGGAQATVTLGTSPATAQGRHRVAQRGRRFSPQINWASSGVRVDSFTHNLREFRSPGEKT